jgi:2-dehydropantoate 2-reductase
MRIAVYGAGAIGGHVAARLVRGGAEVSVVARGAQLAAIRARGIRVVAPDWDETVRVAAASDDPAALGVQDAVLVTVKAPALPGVAAGIGPLLGPRTAVAFVMNGIPWWYFHGHGGAWEGRRLAQVDPGDAVWRAVGPERAVGGVVYSACTVLEPGVVSVANRRNRIVLGEPDGRMSDRIAAIAAPLRAGGFAVDETARIRDAVWAKLLGNLAMGPVCVLGGAAAKDVYGEPAVERAVRASFAEGMAVAASLGCAVEVDVDAQIAHGRAMAHRPSILQDLELGRPMEIDGIYGAALDLARLAGVATPELDRLVALVKVRAREAGLY